MLNTRLRKQIEWHFYNYKADLQLYEQRIQDIVDSGLCINFSHIGSHSCLSNPTEAKAIRIEALQEEMNRKRDWATVVRNTFVAFRFSPEHDIMIALYVKQIPRNTVINEFFMKGLWERTFYRWRDKWLEKAYWWAKEFEIL